MKIFWYTKGLFTNTENISRRMSRTTWTINF